jgi:hypothetical protein
MGQNEGALTFTGPRHVFVATKEKLTVSPDLNETRPDGNVEMSLHQLGANAAMQPDCGAASAATKSIPIAWPEARPMLA